MTARERLAERDAARDELRRLLPPGSTAYTILRHVSRSGMARDISIIVGKGDDVQDVTWLAARALGERLRDSAGHRAIRVPGAGMDMGFHLVYTLSRTLWQEKLATIDALLSNGGTDAGYAITQRWL